jgi:hypothetical protein
VAGNAAVCVVLSLAGACVPAPLEASLVPAAVLPLLPPPHAANKTMLTAEAIKVFLIMSSFDFCSNLARCFFEYGQEPCKSVHHHRLTLSLNLLFMRMTIG